MPKTNAIDVAVAEYTRRQNRQAVKRLTAQAERLNGDRLAKVAGAGCKLRECLDELREIDPASAHHFAVSIGWGDRIPA